MRSNARPLRAIRARLAPAMLVTAALAAPAASGDMIEQQLNGPAAPGPFFWALADIGWYWTPTADYDLSGIQTQLASGFNNINNNFTFTTTLYTDRPDNGGVEISSFSWNGVDFLDGAWVGGSFPAPVAVSAATTYFVGISGWDAALGWGGALTGAGINWVDSPIGAPAESLGAGSSWGSTSGTSGVYDIQFSPAGLGATDQPVIRFLSIPAPATITLAAALAAPAARRRRR